MDARSKTSGLVAAGLATALIVLAGYLDAILSLSWMPSGLGSYKGILHFGLIAAAAVAGWVSIYAGRPAVSAFVGVLCDYHAKRLDGSPEVRVSLLAIRRYSRVKRVYWWLCERLGAERHAREYLTVVGRSPIGGDPEDTRVRFHVGEGVAGLAWKKGALCEAHDLPDHGQDPEKWIELQGNLGIPPEKAQLINRKCRSYVCSPVFNGGDKYRLRGVLSVDSVRPDPFSRHTVTSIERMGHTLGHLPF